MLTSVNAVLIQCTKVIFCLFLIQENILRGNMIRIVMIEDDQEMANLIMNYLLQFNMEVSNFNSPLKGIEGIDKLEPDLIILDLTLPNMDGLDLCRQIRSKHDTPIIISSARSDVNDRVIGLQFGADDYLAKPYDPRELVARIESVLRRYKHIDPDVKIEKKKFIINEDRRLILMDNEKLDLTRGEFEILKLLIREQSKVVSREYILNHVDALQFDSSERSIDVIISRIRQKINDQGKKPKYIHSVRGIGYKLDY